MVGSAWASPWQSVTREGVGHTWFGSVLADVLASLPRSGTSLRLSSLLLQGQD